MERLEENGIVTTCTLVTYPPEEIEDIPLSLETLALKVIMKASWLHDAIQELEGSSPERLTLDASPQRCGLSLSAAGVMGSTEVEFQNDKTLLQSFKCDAEVHNTSVPPFLWSLKISSQHPTEMTTGTILR